MSKIEKALETLNVEIKRYAIYEDSVPHLVTVGGIEIIEETKVGEVIQMSGDVQKININGSGGKKTLLPFRYIDTVFNINHLEELIKFRGMKTLSKEESRNYKVVKKSILSDKIIYIHESKPSTNSIALAKQFQIRHADVIKQIFKLAESNPSILMGIKYGVYKDNIDKGGVRKDYKTRNSGKTGVVEDSTTLSNTKELYDTYLHISEDVYYSFINNMGTPKSLEMRVYRQIKQEEYLKGFQSMREKFYGLGYVEEEIADVIRMRTEYTNELMTTIRDYVKHYNNNSGSNKQLNLETVMRLVFNTVSIKVGIDTTNYEHAGVTRHTLDIEGQNKLKEFELKTIGSIGMIKTTKTPLLEALSISLNISEKQIRDSLNKRGVGELLL